MLGFVNEREEVVVHKVSCPNAARLKSSYGSRLVATRWGGLADRFIARVALEGIDRLGILDDITTTLSRKLAVNIRSLNITTRNEVFNCELSMTVDSTDTLYNIINALKGIKGVKSAKRIS